jgi:hypothetical protein
MCTKASMTVFDLSQKLKKKKKHQKLNLASRNSAQLLSMMKDRLD